MQSTQEFIYIVQRALRGRELENCRIYGILGPSEWSVGYSGRRK